MGRGEAQGMHGSEPDGGRGGGGARREPLEKKTAREGKMPGRCVLSLMPGPLDRPVPSQPILLDRSETQRKPDAGLTEPRRSGGSASVPEHCCRPILHIVPASSSSGSAPRLPGPDRDAGHPEECRHWSGCPSKERARPDCRWKKIEGRLQPSRGFRSEKSYPFYAPLAARQMTIAAIR